jgi:hypothetical protein
MLRSRVILFLRLGRCTGASAIQGPDALNMCVAFETTGCDGSDLEQQRS